MLRVTRWLNPHTRSHTGYGFISDHHWLVMEKYRFEKNNKKASIRQEEGGVREALFVDGVKVPKEWADDYAE